MENEQLLESMEHEMFLTVAGNTMEEAVGNIFQIMRKQIFKEITYPIIQLEAKEVYFEDVKIKKETERFLFLFMPREKCFYTIKARIVVTIKYLKINKEEY